MTNKINENNQLSSVIFWFRRDLRVEDNHGLYRALSISKNVLPIFIFDKDILNELKDRQDKRVAYIHDALTHIQSKLTSIGSCLHVLHMRPIEAFEYLKEKYNIKKIYTNHDYEPYAIKRDQEIINWAASQGITFHSYKDQVIFEKDEILKGDGTPYTIFTPYSKIWKQKYNAQLHQPFPSEKLLANCIKMQEVTLPSLRDIGFENSDSKIINKKLDEAIVKNYEETRNIPSINGTTKLSVQLRFGTTSIRFLAHKANALNEQWLNELIWREFFMMILYKFPQVVTTSFKIKYEQIKWRNDEKEFKQWCDGNTGYAIVDAGMRELNKTGLMHNRVRMIVASFLTKHLLIDWRWGEAYFAEKLLDYDLSANNGNWQWAAGCGCDAAPYFRIFNPMEQTKKFDAKMEYIKQWVDIESTNYPKKIVEHEYARNRVLEVYKTALKEDTKYE
jgi:deoxyribodipyrimidine photo-lyase